MTTLEHDPQHGGTATPGGHTRGGPRGTILVLVGAGITWCAAIAGSYVHFLNNPVTRYRVTGGVVGAEMGFVERYAAAMAGVTMMVLLVLATVLIVRSRRATPPSSALAPATPSAPVHAATDQRAPTVGGLRPPPPPAAAYPAGWYADPRGRHEQRYWDGQAWTSHVADRGRPTLDA